jgi:hypothetical protein
MDSIIEKITMYDILGYLVPGLLFIVLGVSGKVLEVISNETLPIDKLGDFSAILWMAVIVVAYAAGIALSEVMRWVCLVCGKVTSCLGKINFFAKIREKLRSFCQKESDENDRISRIKQALDKGGYLSEEEQRKDWGADDVEKKYDTMYADIQVDENYSRLHNYASSEVFYKNLTMATAAGVAVDILAFGGGYGGTIGRGKEVAIAVVLTAVFWVRFRRFAKKKEKYTLHWFVEKYTNREPSADK